MTDKLSERLDALMAAAEPTDNAERDHSAPDAECVFVDVRPVEFDALLREAAELARRVEDAGVGEVVAGRANSYGGFHVEVAHDAGWHSGQRVRLVPEPPEAP